MVDLVGLVQSAESIAHGAESKAQSAKGREESAPKVLLEDLGALRSRSASLEVGGKWSIR